jgi:polar amino acid transport system substrate-binding protein
MVLYKKYSSKKMSKFKILLAALLSSILVSGCSDNKDNVLLVATSADNPPYEHMREGEIVGFDVDLMNAIAKELGKEVEFKNTEFNGIIASLSSGNVDMAIAAMSVTDQRKEKVDFSIPYTNANIAVLFRKESNLKSEQDLTKGMMVGSQLGTIWSLVAYEMSMKNGFNTESLANNLMLVEELKNGRLDAVIMEEFQVKKFTEKYPELDSFSTTQASSFAIALPKDSKLTDSVNKAIETLQAKGTINELAKKWGIISAD